MKSTKRTIIYICIIAGVALGAFGIANSAFNEQINFQGKLTNSSNVAVENGNYNFKFELYATDTGGVALWTELATTTAQIAVTSGLFSHLLGSVTALDDTIFNQTLWIQVSVGGTSTVPSWETLSPRKKLGAVPAAFEAKRLGGYGTSSFGILSLPATITGLWDFNNALFVASSSASTTLTVTQNGAGSIVDIKNATGSVFTIINNGNVGIGTTAPITQLYIPGKAPSSLATTTTGSTPYFVYVQSNYAYVVNNGANTLQIFDVSNPSSPTSLATTTTGSGPYSVYVQGRYAYVINYTAKTLQIFDVSNPSLPVSVATTTTGSGPKSVYVQGNYAYVVNYTANTLQIFDVSNPSSPTSVATTTAETGPRSVYVQGRYAYLVNYTAGTFQIFDVSNPSSPTSVATTTAGTSPRSVYVQGRYAYAANYDGNTLQIFDVSNPSLPTSVATATTELEPASVYVQGRYAYVVNRKNTANTFQVFDVSNPSLPVSVATTTAGGGPASVYVQGRYAYVTNLDTNTFQIFDVGGAYIQQLEAGGIETGTLSLRNNLQVNNDADIRGGLQIGRGLNVTGASGVYASSGAAVLTISQTGSGNIVDFKNATGSVFTINNTGAIATGTWNATPIGAAYGGTATSTAGWTGIPYITAGVWGTSSAGILSGGQANYLSKWTSGTALSTTTIYDSSGNIGIGTTSPAYTLDVYGSARLGTSTASSLFFRGVSNFNDNFYIDASGNVATGTWQGTAIAAAYGGTATSTFAWTGFPYITAGVWGTSSAGILSGGQENYLSKWTSGTALSTTTIYDSSGNIGIGTTSPAYQLEVIGNLGITGQWGGRTWISSKNGTENQIHSLAVYSGNLYAAQGYGSGDGDVLAFDGSTWSTSYDGSQSAIYSLAVYNGNLYAGQGYGGVGSGDGDVFAFNGSTWSTSYNGTQEDIASLAVYNGKLYAGQGSGSGDGDVLAFDGSTWSTSYDGSLYSITALAVYNGKLYAGQSGWLAGDGDIFVFDGSTWSTSSDLSSYSIASLAVYNGKLYAGQAGVSGDGDIFVFDGSTWSTSYNGSQESFSSLAVYNGKLYAGQANGSGDGDILVYDGNAWSTSYNGTQEVFSSLAVYNGKLYAGQGNGSGDGDVLVYEDNLGLQLAKLQNKTNYFSLTSKSASSTQDELDYYNVNLAAGMSIFGNVGIGTTSPASLLEVYSSTANTDLTITAATSSTYDSRLVFRTGATPATQFVFGVDQSDSNKFKIATSTLGTGDILVIDQGSGNLGIGTTTPATTLTVYGTSTFMGGNVGIGTTSPSNPLEIRSASSTSQLRISYDTSNYATFGVDSGGNLTIQPTAPTNGYVSIYAAAGGAGAAVLGYSAGERLYIASGALLYQSGGGESFRSIGGKFGIGDTDPDGQLEVSANGGANDLFLLSSNDDTDGDRFIVKNSGNVGIGTTTPAEMLSIQATSTTPIFGAYTSSTAPALYITSAGNVGIGTSTPAYTLDAYGTFRALSTSTFSGYVGIGTTTPARVLEVLDAANPQMRITQAGAKYAEFGVDSSGDLTVTLAASGNSFLLLDYNLQVCSGGGCATPPLVLTGSGNLVVESYAYFAGDKIQYPSQLGQPKRSIILTSAGAITPTALGASQTKVDGTNYTYYVLNYADGTTSSAFWEWIMPDSFATATSATGSVDVTIYWTATTTGNAVWGLQTIGVSNNENIDQALANTATTTGAAQATSTYLASVTFSNYVVDWLPQDYISFRVYRQGESGDDVLAANTSLVKVKIEYAVKQESD